MALIICPNCQKTIVVADHIADFVHNCADGPEVEVLATDDKKRIGVSYEANGTTINDQPASIKWQGIANELQGTRAGNEGGRFGGVTPRGNKIQLHYQKSHSEYIDLT